MDDTTQFTFVEVLDGADFDKVLARRVFRYEDETDEAFIEAIDYKSFPIDCED
jgi:hypothetical protein